MNRQPILPGQGIDNNTIVLMLPTNDFNDDALPPVCRQTMEKLQGVMDGEIPVRELDHIDHALTCSVCRERIATTKLILSVLSERNHAPIAPVKTENILSAVLADRLAERNSRFRSRVLAVAGSLAIAAGLLFALWLRWPGSPNQPIQVQPQPEMAKNASATPRVTIEPILAPAPHEGPAPKAVRLGDEFAKAEQAFLGSSRPITEPAQMAPQVLFKLTDVLTQPSEPAPEYEPARKSLLELPEAARNGLQPVTSTTQKAFARLLHDVSAVQVSAKPN
jgi:hypothetical protein